jgi:hypothetical protein
MKLDSSRWKAKKRELLTRRNLPEPIFNPVFGELYALDFQQRPESSNGLALPSFAGASK